MIIEDDKDLNLQLLFDYPTLKLYNWNVDWHLHNTHISHARDWVFQDNHF